MLLTPGCRPALALSIALSIGGSRPAGLEFQGGVRLVYSLDVPAGIAEGRISAGADERELIQETLRIVRERLRLPKDRVRREGETLVVEIPDAPQVVDELIVSSLAQRLEPGERSLTLATTDAEAFPTGGGIVRVGGERMGFERRVADALLGLVRTAPATAHAVAERVALLGTDRIQSLISSPGDLRLLIVAEPADLTALGTDMTREAARLGAWREAQPGRPVSDFNFVSPEGGGPRRGIWWFASARATETGERDGSPVMVLRPRGVDDTFTSQDLSFAFRSWGDRGRLAVAFGFEPGRKDDFTRFTGPATEGGHRGRQMAVVIDGWIGPALRIESPLLFGGIIEGRYTKDEVEVLVRVLLSGPLPVALKLERREPVGPPR